MLMKKYLDGVVKCDYPLVDGFSMTNATYYKNEGNTPPIPGLKLFSGDKYICCSGGWIDFHGLKTDPEQSFSLDFLFQTPDNSWSRIFDFDYTPRASTFYIPSNAGTQYNGNVSLFGNVDGITTNPKFYNVFVRGWGTKVQWNHIAVTYDAKTKYVYLFLNGKMLHKSIENIRKATCSGAHYLGRSSYQPEDPNINCNYANIRFRGEPIFEEEYNMNTIEGLKYLDNNLVYEYTKIKE